MTSAESKPKPLPVIANDSDENDDWIRSLPSAESERQIAGMLEKWRRRQENVDLTAKNIMAKLTKRVRHKHLAGRHAQKRHGWRFGADSKPPKDASDSELAEYNRRVGARKGSQPPPKPAPPKPDNKKAESGLIGTYDTDGGKVYIVKGRSELPAKLVKRLDQEGMVRVIYNSETKNWHIIDTNINENAHGYFSYEALEGQKPKYTEMIQGRGVYDPDSNTLSMYDFSSSLDAIGSGPHEEKFIQAALRRVASSAKYNAFTVNGKQASFEEEDFNEMMGFKEISTLLDGEDIEVLKRLSDRHRRIMAFKHQMGRHPQKRHGWRFAGLDAARRAMQGASAEERDVYRAHARGYGQNMPKIGELKRKPKPPPPPPPPPKPKPKPKTPSDNRFKKGTFAYTIRKMEKQRQAMLTYAKGKMSPIDREGMGAEKEACREWLQKRNPKKAKLEATWIDPDFSDRDREKITDMVDYFNSVVNKKVLSEVGSQVKFTSNNNNRGSYRSYTSEVCTTPGWDTSRETIIHELGHHLEYNGSNALQSKARKFLNYRTKGERSKKLKTITHVDYDDDEWAKPDKFMSPYMGKIYYGGSTEIISMGLQYLYEKPAVFARTDPEYFNFMLAVVTTGGVGMQNMGDYSE